MLLLLSELGSNKILGPVSAIGIVFAVLTALTLLPALMLWAGRAAFWPVRPKFGAHVEADDVVARRGVWPKVARLVARRPRMTWIVSTLLLAIMALGITQLKADGVPSSEFVLGAIARPATARRCSASTSRAVPARPPSIIASEDAVAATSPTCCSTTDGVESVAVASEDSPSGSLPVTEDGIQPLGPPGTPAGEPTVIDGAVQLDATLADASDSDEAEAVVGSNFGASSSAVSTAEDPVLVGGTTAVGARHEGRLDPRSQPHHPARARVILLILMLLLRAIVAPLLLIATVVLSFAAALGVSALVFNGVFGFPGADPVVPLFGFVFLVALGVDYNIFLMTRVREESMRHGTREGVLRGLVVTGGVITSAGLVLAATFAALGVLPILFLAQISFIVAFGVLLDTFLVRSLLVPALRTTSVASSGGRRSCGDRRDDGPSRADAAAMLEASVDDVLAANRTNPPTAPDPANDEASGCHGHPLASFRDRYSVVRALERARPARRRAAWPSRSPAMPRPRARRRAPGAAPSLFVSMMKYGQAPWFSGSSCAHTSSAFG